MRDRLDELPGRTEVVLVTFTDRRRARAYREANDLPFPVLVDEGRDTYRAYGLDRGSVARVWGLRSLRRYLEIIRRDGLSGLRRPTEDTLQLGGDFVIGADGTLVWAFWGEGPDDRPGVDELFAAAARG